MEDLLIEVLENTGFPAYRQGSLSDSEEWQESFFTFWNDDSPGEAFYDNEEHGCRNEYTIYFYSTDPALPYEMIKQAKRELKEAGFIVTGNGFDIPSGRQTHIGRAIEIIYKEAEIKCQS